MPLLPRRPARIYHYIKPGALASLCHTDAGDLTSEFFFSALLTYPSVTSAQPKIPLVAYHPVTYINTASPLPAAAYPTTLMSTSAAQKQSRRTTWPSLQMLTPTMSKSRVESPPPSEDIDEDPFSHFLSPVLDEDDPFDGLEYNAGINTFDEEVEQKRNKFRARLEEKWGNLMSRRSPSPPKNQGSPRTPPSEDQLPELIIDDLEGFGSPSSSPPTLLPTLKEMIEEEDGVDGWEADRRRTLRRKNNFHFDELDRPVTAPSPTTSRPKLQRPRFRRLRTLSGRPHSFVAPSPHLWTVSEHDEILDALQKQRRSSQ